MKSDNHSIPLDHSKIYQEFKLKNIPHKMRLKSIFKIINNLELREPTYCDIGCSNGYITHLLAEYLKSSQTMGFDHNQLNLDIAQERYEGIDFVEIDLNNVTMTDITFDFITCFETLEHVGNPTNALVNIFNKAKPNGKILISVPIETETIGIIKFLIKTIIFQYNLDEINTKNDLYFYFRYLWSLIKKENISKYREPKDHYGTHFGFDYRIVEEWLVENSKKFNLIKEGSTAFFLVEN